MQGAELREIRSEMGWTLHDMALVLGMSGNFISMMERGERPIERRTALAVRYIKNINDTLAEGVTINEALADD
ncbi:MAG TPA: helix-turn-helix transcriptional regulator [Sphingobium sp.]|uniref:helix-turn-helix domain-containing protein n=1 Tax=Sphingobium sp. TaxID=1912891 RepID=UPI002ED2DA82